MCFGKSGRRCKSLQCWFLRLTSVKIDILAFIVKGGLFFVRFRYISLQKRRLTPSLFIQYKGRWGVSAHQPLMTPLLISWALRQEHCKPSPSWKKRTKLQNLIWSKKSREHDQNLNISTEGFNCKWAIFYNVNSKRLCFKQSHDKKWSKA